LDTHVIFSQRIDRLAKSQVISVLEEVQLDLAHSISNITVMSGRPSYPGPHSLDLSSPVHRGTSSFKKFDDVCRSNENIFKATEASFETMRKKILTTFNETDTKAIAYNKDTQSVRENYEVVSPKRKKLFSGKKHPALPHQGIESRALEIHLAHQD
jgi:hypothetical protein